MFTVKIITKMGDNTITEVAGMRGEKTILSVAGPFGIRVNPNPRKIHGWKTREGAMRFIGESLARSFGKDWNSTYEIETA